MKNLMLVIGMLCMIGLSCANAENQTEQTDSIAGNVPEKPQNLVKQLLINDDDWQKRVVDFEYDESGRLVAVSTTYNAETESEFTEKVTVTYGNGTIVCEGPKEKLTLRLDAEGFVIKKEWITEDTVTVAAYEYNSGKLSASGDADCGNKYLWDGDNISKITDLWNYKDEFVYDTIVYKYSDVVRPNVDVLAFSYMFGGFPTVESLVSKGLVSRYMPSEIKGSNYNSDGTLNSVSLLTCKYSTDEYGRISSFEYTHSRNNGSIFEDNSNVTVKVVY